ncbi:MAG: hypothetical protein FJ006_08140 [Chloroflexi bacterium]|nr:hypothetical protein [Chloroflexota bacterium]
MKGNKRSIWLCKGGLALFLAVCLFALVIYLGDAYNGKTSLSSLDFESMDAIEQQAWQLAREVVGASRNAQEQFVTELLALYDNVKDSELVIFCNSGGWGKEPLSSDYQGQSWLKGITAELTQLGYKYYVIENIRTGSGLLEALFEFKEQLTHFPSKAQELAAKIDFLTRHVTGLKVIVTGQSNGAAFTGEVGKRLENNQGVYSIQVGIPFWHRVCAVSHSLVIADNGIGADVLTQKDVLTLFKANWAKLFIINHVPSFTPVDWFITRVVFIFVSYNFGLGLDAPGHEYMWEYPGVGPVIEAFLVENFGVQ